VSCESNRLKVPSDKCKVYLIFRDSDSKEGYFAKKFNNEISSKVSHVGILYYRNDWLVLHADNLKGNCIENISLNKFRLNNKDKMDIKLLEILDLKVNRYFYSEVDSFSNLNKKFDLSFSKNSLHKTYCSKFVVDFLQNHATSLTFKLSKKPLTNIESSYLNRDTLEYYPVDLFFTHPRFRKLPSFQ
jgi:hypothetical protein